MIIMSDPFAPLTADQQNALDTFRENLTNAGLLSPSSHDEATLIRFLRARGFDPAAAQQQFAATEQWRKQHDVDNLYASFTADELQTSRRFYPRWTGHRDKVHFFFFLEFQELTNSHLSMAFHCTSTILLPSSHFKRN